MSKKASLFLLIPVTVLLFVFMSVEAKNQLSTSSQTPSTCDSFGFGVVKSQVEKKAPSFSLKTLDGNEIGLDGLKGKNILLKFWATWCPTCLEELPMMQKFSDGGRDQLVILLAAIDGEKEKKVQRVIKENKITLPVLLDPKAKIARSYGVNFVPVSFLISQEGLIIGTVVGERDWVSQKAWSAVKELFNLR